MALKLFDAFGSVEKTLNATWVDTLARYYPQHAGHKAIQEFTRHLKSPLEAVQPSKTAGDYALTDANQSVARRTVRGVFSGACPPARCDWRRQS